MLKSELACFDRNLGFLFGSKIVKKEVYALFLLFLIHHKMIKRRCGKCSFEHCVLKINSRLRRPTNLKYQPNNRRNQGHLHAEYKIRMDYILLLLPPCSGGAARAIEVFTRSSYVDIVLESIKYCQKEKGLRIHAWCIMSNHVHLMISTKFGIHPSNILRDFKKFTSKQIIAAIEDKEQPESRRGWMLWLLKKAREENSKNTNYQPCRRSDLATGKSSYKTCKQQIY
jgi:REP element-mobilizing transposase RayT